MHGRSYSFDYQPVKEVEVKVRQWTKDERPKHPRPPEPRPVKLALTIHHHQLCNHVTQTEQHCTKETYNSVPLSPSPALYHIW